MAGYLARTLMNLLYSLGYYNNIPYSSLTTQLPSKPHVEVTTNLGKDYFRKSRAHRRGTQQ